jgi:peptide/nickel transport system substrate-binding protein
MSENRVINLNNEYQRFLDGEIDRRQLLKRAGTLGLSAATLPLFGRMIPVSAQEATPAASPTGDLSFTSITAAEADARIHADYPFTDPASTGGVVIIGSATGITGTNMMLASDAPTLPFMNLVSEYLVGANPKDAQFMPGLADSWDIAADGKTYTFHLRSGVTWHDGAPFTADDVILSFDAQSSPETGTLYTTSLNDAVASYEKVDDLTVKIVATDQFAQIVFLANANPPIMPKHVWGEIPFADWATDPGSTGEDPARVIGTGPFIFSSLDTASNVATIEKNPNYYGQVPTIDQVKLQVWPDTTSAVEALRADQLDIIYGQLPPVDANSLKDDPEYHVDIYDTYDFTFFGYNLDPTRTALFQDVRTRQALAFALDRQSIVDNIQLGYAEVAEGPQPVLSIAYAPDRMGTHYTYDVEKAKQLLADAGWADADGDGVLELGDLKLEFSLVYGAGSPVWNQLTAYAQEAWTEIGVRMTPKPVDFSTVLIPIVSGPTPSHDFEMLGISLSWGPSGDQSIMFSTNGYEGGFNFMKYSNSEVDRMNAESNQTIDDAERIELLIESANLVNDDLPANILFFAKDATGSSARLNNFFPNTSSGGFWSLPYVWIAD